MDGHTYIKQRQILWARRRGIKLIGSAGDRGVKAYAEQLEANLFQPLSTKARACYEQGDGNELGNGCMPGKLQAVHSSAAIATNVFDRWLCAKDPRSMLRALGLPTTSVSGIDFECKFPISPRHRRAPNIDVVIHYGTDTPQAAVAIECKFTEAYGNRRHGGMKQGYLDGSDLWTSLPSLHDLASRLYPNDNEFKHLHPAQLIKHVLGLNASFGPGKYRLVYLWYDVPTPDGDVHRQELMRFAELARKDGVAFHHMTWQDLILCLAKLSGDADRDYVDYLADRYL